MANFLRTACISVDDLDFVEAAFGLLKLPRVYLHVFGGRRAQTLPILVQHLILAALIWQATTLIYVLVPGEQTSGLQEFDFETDMMRL